MTKQEELDECNKELRKATRTNAKLTEENDALKLSVADLLATNERLRVEGPGEIPRFTRGKLPGEKLIKVDMGTGRFEVIEKAEWDSLR